MGLRGAVRANRGIAEQVLRRVERSTQAAGGKLLQGMLWPMVVLFEHADLLGEEWPAFSGYDHQIALRVMATHDGVIDVFTSIDLYIPDPLHRLGLFAVIDSSSPGAAAALAFLARDNERARNTYDELSRSHPQIPAVPELSFSDITLAARLRAIRLLEAETPLSEAALRSALNKFAAGDPGPARAVISDEGDLSGDAFSLEEDGEHGTAMDGGWEDAQEHVPDETYRREHLLTAIEDLDPLWTQAREAARQANAALDKQAAARREDLDKLVEVSAEARHLAEVLSDLLGRQIPSTRAALAEAADNLRRGLAEENKPWLRRLARVEGPDAVSDALAAVRAVARLALDDARQVDDDVLGGLAALLRLILLGVDRRAGRPVGYEEVVAAEAAAREALPAETQGLVLAAAVGDLLLPELEESPEQVTATEAEGTASPDEEAASRRGMPSEVDETLAAGELSPAQVERAAVPPSAPDQSESLPEPEVDLSDLDALLAGGAGARLAALAGQKEFLHRRQRDEPDQPANETPGSAQDIRAESAEVGERSAQPPDVVAQAETALLRQQRFGLAADIHAAVASSPSKVAARRLAALAVNLHHPAGALAVAFADEAALVKREHLADDRPAQLLAWASAACVAVLSPSAGAAEVLTELGPCVADYPALTEVGQALAEASRVGVVVIHEAADAVSAVADAENAAAERAHQAHELLRRAHVRTIKYAPANVVYQAWLSSDGILGSLLVRVARNDHSKANDVRDEVVKLRGQVERNIDTTFATQRQRNVRMKIVAGARSTLRQRYLQVIDIAAEWAEIATEIQSAAAKTDPRYGWQAAALARLRGRLNDARVGIAPDLDRLRAGAEDHRLSAAADAALDLINKALDTCDGRPPVGPEVSPTYALHGELLASDIPLLSSTLVPDAGFGDQVLEVLLRLSKAAAIDAVAAYDVRARAGDHDLTAALIHAVRATDEATADALERQREADIAAQAADIAAGIAATTAKIDARRMAGTLDDNTWSALASRAEELRGPTRRDYGRIRRELEAIETELDCQEQSTITETVKRIEDLSETPEVQAVADTLKGLARSGQVASAEEYLELVLAGGSLPTGTRRTDHLMRFFPALPDIAAGQPDLLEQLRTVLVDRASETRAYSVPVVETIKKSTGLDPASLSRLRAENGTRAIGAWLAIAGRNTKHGTDVRSALGFILAEAGLEFADAVVQPGSPDGRTWITLTGVRGTGSALTPVLGSAMSPSGDTLRVLLVRSAASPATVVEWMSEEPADQTVLALWFPGALSAAERGSLADASRGRPRPPVLILDEAALAYLICQAEPRRATFAAIALPFTAASPYRDTPGYTAPEMFYGRTEELAKIKDLTGPSIVYGGRQLGKSALLRTAQREFDNGATRRAVLTSIFTVGGDSDPERLWSALWPRLAELGIAEERPPAGDLAEAVHQTVIEWTTAFPDRALLILLDEADAFLEADAAGNRFTHVDWCRRIMLDSEQRAKFIFAGLHRTARFESLPNQPLAHFGRPVCVGPLHPQAAHDLLTEPLAALGFHFEDAVAIPARVLALANNMPALLQLFGAALVAHLTSRPMTPGSPPTTVRGDDVDEVFADTRLLEAFREKYIHTLNLDHRYLVIAYVVAQAAHELGAAGSLTLTQLSDNARAAWPTGFARCGADDFRGLVTECVDLGVLAMDNGGYRIRTPNVLRLLGTEEEVFETLYTASERLHLQSPADGTAYRRRTEDSGHRMPLTERQIGEVFNARDRLLVLSGSPALGVDRVVRSLEQAKDEGYSRLDNMLRLSNITPAGLRNAAFRVAGGHALILADLRAATGSVVEEMLTTAHEVIGERRQSLTVALIAGPQTAPVWIRHDARIDLALVNETGLRLWCDEDNLPFRDDESRRRLLDTTGGWPLLVAKVAAAARTDTPVTDAAKALAEVMGWLSTKAGALKLVTAAGLATAVDPVRDALASVFSLVAEATERTGETRDDLIELLIFERPDLLACVRAAGFADVGETLDALTALSCIVGDDTGLLRTEPVLTHAFQLATKESR